MIRRGTGSPNSRYSFSGETLVRTRNGASRSARWMQPSANVNFRTPEVLFFGISPFGRFAYSMSTGAAVSEPATPSISTWPVPAGRG